MEAERESKSEVKQRKRKEEDIRMQLVVLLVLVRVQEEKKKKKDVLHFWLVHGLKQRKSNQWDQIPKAIGTTTRENKKSKAYHVHINITEEENHGSRGLGQQGELAIGSSGLGRLQRRQSVDSQASSATENNQLSRILFKISYFYSFS